MPSLGFTVVFAAVTGLSPVQIYWKAQAAVNALPQAPYIAFTFQNLGLTRISLDQSPTNPYQEMLGQPGQAPEAQQQVFLNRELLRVVVRVSDGAAALVALKNPAGQAIAQPQAGVVTNSLNFMAVSNVLRLGDFPLADFGLRYGTPSRAGFFEPPYPSPEASTLRVIATVYAFETPPYRIVDLGDTTVDGRPVYHLSLDPLRNPTRNVLRQMWIDKESFLPVRYLALRTVADPDEYFTYLITVNCADIDGHLVNIDAQGISPNGEGKWRISDVTFPADEPDWVFDPTQWRAHHDELIPNLPP
jgi:hypothetical protein